MNLILPCGSEYGDSNIKTETYEHLRIFKMSKLRFNETNSFQGCYDWDSSSLNKKNENGKNKQTRKKWWILAT